MMLANNKHYRYRICQGDVFNNVYFIEDIEENVEQIAISRIKFPYVIVLSQDCDLQSEYFKHIESRRNLLSIIVAPLYLSEKLFEGDLGKTGLDALNIRHQYSKRFRNVKEFNNGVDKCEFDRYHHLYIEKDDYIVDFKHFFCVSTQVLLKMKRKTEGNFVFALPEFYRERLTQRFCNYLSRIGLPPSSDELEKLETANMQYEEKYSIKDDEKLTHS